MSPLSATALRAALAAQPSKNHRGAVVPVTLKLSGVTFVPDNLYNALQGVWGAAKVNNPVPSRRHWQLEFDGDSNMIGGASVAPGSFETDVEGWVAHAVTGSLSRNTSRKLFGAASCEVVCPGTNVNEGIHRVVTGLTANLLYRLTAWVRLESGNGSLQLVLAERTAADALVDSVTQAFTATSSWQRVTVTNQFGATGVGARPIIQTAGTQASTFDVDGVSLSAVEDRAEIDSAALNPDWNANPTVVNLLLSFDGPTFRPVDLYDALDAIYPTVSSNKDGVGQGDFSFLITA